MEPFLRYKLYIDIYPYLSLCPVLLTCASCGRNRNTITTLDKVKHEIRFARRDTWASLGRRRPLINNWKQSLSRGEEVGKHKIRPSSLVPSPRTHSSCRISLNRQLLGQVPRVHQSPAESYKVEQRRHPVELPKLLLELLVLFGSFLVFVFQRVPVPPWGAPHAQALGFAAD